LLADLYPVLKEIIEWHRRGTRYGIHVDAEDGLLFAGEAGVQLTWMDARIGDWVVTARTGKPVEINALWHFALTRMATWAKLLNDKRSAETFARDAARVADSFATAFWYEAGGYLFDVVDCPPDAAIVASTNARGQRADASLRPNQMFAISPGTGLLDEARARAVVAVCARELLTPMGLRSLAAHDPRYIGRYEGGPRERDAAYHQGTVWGWLLGPFALAHYRVHGDAQSSMRLLDGFAAHLSEACLGTISEIFDADAPHVPRGCFAQAWSVSETLRAWHHLNRASSQPLHATLGGGLNP
jgi:predicted glycogen debranching enzyme